MKLRVFGQPCHNKPRTTSFTSKTLYNYLHSFSVSVKVMNNNLFTWNWEHLVNSGIERPGISSSTSKTYIYIFLPLLCSLYIFSCLYYAVCTFFPAFTTVMKSSSRNIPQYSNKTFTILYFCQTIKCGKMNGFMWAVIAIRVKVFSILYKQ